MLRWCCATINNLVQVVLTLAILRLLIEMVVASPDLERMSSAISPQIGSRSKTDLSGGVGAQYVVCSRQAWRETTWEWDDGAWDVV